MLLMTLVYQDKPKIYRDKLESRPQKSHQWMVLDKT